MTMRQRECAGSSLFAPYKGKAETSRLYEGVAPPLDDTLHTAQKIHLRTGLGPGIHQYCNRIEFIPFAWQCC